MNDGQSPCASPNAFLLVGAKVRKSCFWNRVSVTNCECEETLRSIAGKNGNDPAHSQSTAGVGKTSSGSEHRDAMLLRTTYLLQSTCLCWSIPPPIVSSRPPLVWGGQGKARASLCESHYENLLWSTPKFMVNFVHQYDGIRDGTLGRYLSPLGPSTSCFRT